MGAGLGVGSPGGDSGTPGICCRRMGLAGAVGWVFAMGINALAARDVPGTPRQPSRSPCCCAQEDNL